MSGRALKPLLGLLLWCCAAGADSIETIQLHHRPAAELIPLIKPMLHANDSVTGQGFQLFVRSSEQNLEQLRRMVEQLDTASQQLLISVFQGSERDLRALAVGGGFNYQGSDGDISVGSGERTTRGGSVRYSTGGASVNVNTLSTRGRLSDNPIHQLRVSEGAPGYIETGQSIPYFSGPAWWGRHHRDGAGVEAGVEPHGAGVVAGVEFKDVTTGFYVLPRVHGDQVTLDISPHKQALSDSRPGTIDTQGASTRVTGPLGQWMTIGGVTDQTSRSSSGIGTRLSTDSRTNDSIWIKAEPVQ